MKIYVASSWRNGYQQEVVRRLREEGHQVYDFKNPEGKTGFSWSQIDEGWESWTTEEFKANLYSEIAEKGFASDYGAMKWADACVMVLPCGRSARLESGWFAGRGKPTLILLGECEPDLMYKIADDTPRRNLRELEKLR